MIHINNVIYVLNYNYYSLSCSFQLSCWILVNLAHYLAVTPLYPLFWGDGLSCSKSKTPSRQTLSCYTLAFVVDNRCFTPDFMLLGCVDYWYLFQKKNFGPTRTVQKVLGVFRFRFWWFVGNHSNLRVSLPRYGSQLRGLWRESQRFFFWGAQTGITQV